MKILKIKQMGLALMVSGCLTMAMPMAHAGGIPVFDGAAVEHAIQQGVQLKTQIDNQISQLKELEAQVKSQTGSRNVGSLITNSMDTMGNIGGEWADLYGKVKPSGNVASDLNGKGYSREANLQQMLKNQQFNIKALEGAQKRVDEIIKLGQQISQTQDIKASADLRNRIATEQAYIQAMQVKLDMAERIAANQEKIQQQRYQSQQACMAKHIRDGNYKACM